MPVKTLLLYHDEDLEYAMGVRKQLTTWVRDGDVELLEPLLPGDPEAISLVRIQESDLILFLMSASSFADERLGVTLLNASIAQATAGCAILVPIYVKSYPWEDSELVNFMGAFAPKPISQYDPIDDGCFAAITSLKQVVDDFEEQISAQKLNFAEQHQLINTFNFSKQINEQMGKQLMNVQGWCKVCLLQGAEKSGFNILGWRIRNELAGVPKGTPTTFRSISLNDSREQGAEALKYLICQESLSALSVVELAKQLRQHLQSQHFVLYLNDLIPGDALFITEFFTELSAAWAASKGDANSKEPAFHFWCFLIYYGTDPIEVVLKDTAMTNVQFPRVDPVASSDFDNWMNCHQLDADKQAKLRKRQAEIIGNAPNNQVVPVLERLCKRLAKHIILYEEYVLKLDNGLNP